MTGGRGGEAIQIGTHLDGDAQIGESLMLEQDAVRERNHAVARQGDLVAAAGFREIEMRIRGVLCRNQRQDFAVIQGGRRIENLGTVRERQSDEHKHVEAFRGGQHLEQSLCRTVKKHGVREEVAAAAAGQRKSGEHQQTYILCSRLADTVDDSVGVIVRIRDPDNRGCSGGF